LPISSTQRKVGPTPGNGVATDFPFSFKVFAASDLQVIRTSANGGDTILSVGTHYNVTLNADQDNNPGGTVSLLTPLATGLKLTLVSNVPLLQPTDWQNQGRFRGSARVKANPAARRQRNPASHTSRPG
jgi:hypothetical protein